MITERCHRLCVGAGSSGGWRCQRVRARGALHAQPLKVSLAPPPVMSPVVWGARSSGGWRLAVPAGECARSPAGSAFKSLSGSSPSDVTCCVGGQELWRLAVPVGECVGSAVGAAFEGLSGSSPSGVPYFVGGRKLWRMTVPTGE